MLLFYLMKFIIICIIFKNLFTLRFLSLCILRLAPCLISLKTAFWPSKTLEPGGLEFLKLQHMNTYVSINIYTYSYFIFGILVGDLSEL